ncbi:ubiquitin elongating factor core-domain-containing protein [Crucibulum laeve]|uniref:RING-type E3 ubiquitin transferase n=1 Tax=Crucibulum laeve TaxID=68775 RepID=A0A5C3M7J6_9AGAR|nr:ubiquitin elongating factor core-domain-containing protein [Crucibulum laeve]
MSDNAPTPQDDAERIRLKRLAKLQGVSTPRASTSGPSTPASSTPPPAPKSKPIPKPTPAATPRLPVSSPSSRIVSSSSSAAPSPVPTAQKKKVLQTLDLPSWEHDAVSKILKVTLSRDEAQKSGFDLVWLKYLSEELKSEGIAPDHLSSDIIDRVLIARLEVDSQGMTDDLDYLPVLASLPPQQTTFEYLVGAWKRLNATRSAVLKKGFSPMDTKTATDKLEKIRELLISYAGLTLQEPGMFPQPTGKPLGPPELLPALLSLSAFSGPLGSSSSNPSSSVLSATEVEPFLQDLSRRFSPDDELDPILAPVVKLLLFHPSLSRPEGLGGGDSGWRAIIGGLEVLVSVKGIPELITRMPEWIPEHATAVTFERMSLMGPLLRLGVFMREWPTIAQTYFSDPEKRTRDDIESSFASLRGTLKSLQTSLFQVFNSLVRAGAGPREAVLQYFARVIKLNLRRAGMQVDPDTVASDSFMVNLQSVLLRFAEPFMDANYSRMDKIDPLFYAHSDRIDINDETRIKATSEEASQWVEQNKEPNAAPPNFISNIFYLAIAMSHYGYLRTIQSYNGLARHVEDVQRHLDMLQGDGSWMGTPMQTRTETTINLVKIEKAKIRMQQLSFETGLLEPELVFRCIGFTTFLSTWLIRQVDPKKQHPKPPAALPLSKEVPMSFRVLPEYIVEDIVDYLHFSVQASPEKFELAGKIELLTFVLTFLTSTWYIKNPFLKSKINDVLFMSIWGYGRERNGILGDLLNTHPMALKHLMPALMHFYIEVEQTGASSQFYDKFNARRNIAYILKVVWNNPSHRQALNEEAKNVDEFVRFVNLMINDVTYLMDESLTDMTQIHEIQVEMDDKATWESKPREYRREREGTLRSLERQASGYTTLGRSTVELLKVFTAETKAPFMMPEIVDRLAAMLDYNLHVLVGPRYQTLKVRDPAKLKFDPKALLSDILQVFLNLCDQGEFVKAVANDGRSYSKELFESAAEIAIRRSIKTEAEMEKLRLFVVKVEEAKATMDAEDDLGEIPEEFLDPLMYTVMKDPVLLPSSKNIIDRSTIKSHLLSDSKDPFNRAPLKIEDVIPVPELKLRITTFLSDRRNKNTALDKSAEEIVHMDTA